VKLVLRTDVDQVGKKGDIVDVADGYGRNCHLPKRLAFLATDGVADQASRMRRGRDQRDAADRAAAEEIARKLVPQVVTIAHRAGGEGKLFGSVTAAEVAEAVTAQTGIEIDRRKLHLDEPIKSVGTHLVPAKLHGDVEFPITVEVVAS
jgi:large subunit ribosomal protein L9